MEDAHNAFEYFHSVIQNLFENIALVDFIYYI